MKKLDFIVLLAMFLLGCGTPGNTSSPKVQKPQFNIHWRYEGDKIHFTVINLTADDVLVAFPLREKPGDRSKLAYRIYNADPKNFSTTYTGLVWPLVDADFRIIPGAVKELLPHVTDQQVLHFTVPSLVKDFTAIFRIEVDIKAVPFSQLKSIDNFLSLAELLIKNEQTYVVDFKKVGYEKREGNMELSSHH